MVKLSALSVLYKMWGSFHGIIILVFVDIMFVDIKMEILFNFFVSKCFACVFV